MLVHYFIIGPWSICCLSLFDTSVPLTIRILPCPSLPLPAFLFTHDPSLSFHLLRRLRFACRTGTIMICYSCHMGKSSAWIKRQCPVSKGGGLFYFCYFSFIFLFFAPDPHIPLSSFSIFPILFLSFSSPFPIFFLSYIRAGVFRNRPWQQALSFMHQCFTIPVLHYFFALILFFYSVLLSLTFISGTGNENTGTGSSPVFVIFVIRVISVIPVFIISLRKC